MTRALAHVKETIACRAFEHALHPNVIPQATRQGADYGIDYSLLVFDDQGELERTVSAQIKYVAPEAILWPNPAQTQIYDYTITRRYRPRGPTMVRLRLPRAQLREWLNRTKSPADVLLVAANEMVLYYVWVSDLAEYYLAWLPGVLDGPGTLTVTLCSVRCFQGRDWPHEVDTDSAGWLGSWCKPRTIDSLVNVATIAYLQTVDTRTRLPRMPAPAAYWEFLRAREPERPVVPVLFGKYLRLLGSTPSMCGWSVSAIAAWNDAFAVPLAFYLLAGSDDPATVLAGVRILDRVSTRGHFWPAYFELRYAHYKSDCYLDSEYLNAVADFLAAAAGVHRIEAAQLLLVRAFANFDYSLGIWNVYATRISVMALTQRLLRGPSLDLLRRLCKVSGSVVGTALRDAIETVATRWADEQADEK